MDWPDKPCTRCAIWARRKCVCHCIIFPGCNPLVTVEQLQKKKKTLLMEEAKKEKWESDRN